MEFREQHVEHQRRWQVHSQDNSESRLSQKVSKSRPEQDAKEIQEACFQLKRKKDGLLDVSSCIETIFTLDEINFREKKAIE